MRFIYGFLVQVSWWALHILALFKKKINLFVSGRKKTFLHLKSGISEQDSIIWMHVASLGEYEQGLPILQRWKDLYPRHKFLLTFFSPSGFEVKKDDTPADIVVYLPMDTLRNAKKFIKLVHPQLAIFVKYEIWPNYLGELQKSNIPTLLISAVFSKRQVFFKPWGGFMRHSLKAFTHFFVQDGKSKELLTSIGFENTTVSGDTRFERVSEILKRDNNLKFMDSFKQNNFCFVAGSTWQEDEEVILDFINHTPYNLKAVIAPHDIKKSHIDRLVGGISKSVTLFSEIEGKDLSAVDVVVVDTIGILTKIYSYADIAYVGGGFATGLHNTLEPAVFGIPVIIGPNYNGFKEAEDLVLEKGIYVVDKSSEFNSIMEGFLKDPHFRTRTGNINDQYISKNQGASDLIIKHIQTLL
ncbi:3-deoxy-D-manno-octulosonic acid transferase [Flagellimonas allohymeniacidonis]|uniref:3-deoxy-D-manno-octulosonic acid transferase n=1 Tax=Flagellimonas allohymeniacidonis TaxID=2517819 RepID=A0A4Q8Q9Z4_9FLAO|nr:glycosyltransferase N-terminal domain-containing protein [Allomuricauda hymeniacidonis]TAI47102.1 3-deoxy-D-manno-octulosonic acid transferase [Allomuricauda hymeniacidonis]